MSDGFPEFACPYAKRLAAVSPRFARQCYDRLVPRQIVQPQASNLKLQTFFSPDPFGELTHAS